MIVIIFWIYLIITPLLLMILSRKWKWIDKVSPMAILYVIGLGVANTTQISHDSFIKSSLDTLSNLCIPFAIPLMLITCNLAKWNTKKALKVFLSGMMAILIVTIAGFFLFKGQNDSQSFAKICAVAIGIYTGGIPNMGAIAHSVGMSQPTFLYITSYDLIITGLYLVFVICFGKPVFRKLLPNKEKGESVSIQEAKPIPWKYIWQTFNRFKGKPTPDNSLLGISLGITLLGLLAYVICPESIATPITILTLTTLSIIATFIPAVQRINKKARNELGPNDPLVFKIGLYLIYVFCFSMANQCDIRTMDLTGSLNILYFITFVVFGSLVLQILFAKMMKIDGDSTLAASVALINSPPFVPMVAALLNNKELIVLGITIGMLGYMVGNYLGLAIFYLLTI